MYKSKLSIILITQPTQEIFKLESASPSSKFIYKLLQHPRQSHLQNVRVQPARICSFTINIIIGYYLNFLKFLPIIDYDHL